MIQRSHMNVLFQGCIFIGRDRSALNTQLFPRKHKIIPACCKRLRIFAQVFLPNRVASRCDKEARYRGRERPSCRWGGKRARGISLSIFRHSTAKGNPFPKSRSPKRYGTMNLAPRNPCVRNRSMLRPGLSKVTQKRLSRKRENIDETQERRNETSEAGRVVVICLNFGNREIDATHLHEIRLRKICFERDDSQMRKFVSMTGIGEEGFPFADGAITNALTFYFHDFILQSFHAVEIYGNLFWMMFWQMRR